MRFVSRRTVRLLILRIDLFTHISESVPGFAIERKDESLLMKILSCFLFFNEKFMSRYATMVYPKVYVPKWWGKNKRTAHPELSIMTHEYMHLLDRKRMGWLFNIMYLSPQIFSLLALGAFWNRWFLFALLFLLPWPSPGRAWLEYRGYRMTMAFQYWTKRTKCDIDWIVNQFTGASYYFMFPFREFLIKKFNEDYNKIVDGDLTNELKKVKCIIDRRGRDV